MFLSLAAALALSVATYEDQAGVESRRSLVPHPQPRVIYLGGQGPIVKFDPRCRQQILREGTTEKAAFRHGPTSLQCDQFDRARSAVPNQIPWCRPAVHDGLHGSIGRRRAQPGETGRVVIDLDDDPPFSREVTGAIDVRPLRSCDHELNAEIQVEP
jgi:hypothetical protein